jgi:radical SAM superfamily enzyme YgiQ (UPF0313 family)
MRAPGDVLLVSCYELGHQPLGIAWAAAFLQARGYAPAIMDVSVEPFDAEKARRARVVAVSVPMHTALRVGAALIGRVRVENPACHVVAYGLYAQLNRDYLLGHGVDSVIGGEAEAPLLALVEALEAGTLGPAAGVGTADRSAAPHLERLAFPVPSRAGLPSLEEYARLERDGRHELVGYVEASRGCKHLCRHCPIPPVYGGRFFAVPVDVVFADVRQQVRAGATHVTFGDPDFLNGPRHALAVARGLHAEFPAVTFDFTAKVEHLLRHRTLLPELRALGCAFVVSAVESLSDTVLRHLDKGHTRADVEALVALVRQAAIALRPTWVAFTPWTTLGDYRAMLDFVVDEGLVDHVDPVQYSLRLLVPPGSLLAGYPAMRPHLGRLDEAAFSYAWTHPDPRMDALHAEIARVVEAAAEAHEDEALTLERVRALTAAVDGIPARPLSAAWSRSDRVRPPRLTEPWFC